ncbi:hypothetical protein PSTEL_07310 [Paenibacillus stellifer]|uniref:Nucleotidyltransferase family protein n=1 Tax=Paenibacillus stellifer TaxID=169760 RepID=A0A089N2M6_9BACL|nr:nucleotidyltransferase family protein [Paenibacillus stellifer]AIQ62939.1 hypothetical protein PSTEL_07310 [Paenibacillus stellifer]
MHEVNEVRHLSRLTGIFEESDFLMPLFRLAAEFSPHPYYIGAGCLMQTVWNRLTGRPSLHGISDVDYVYFDASDTGYEAEDEMVRAARSRFAGLAVPVDVKNQARVHLWYPEKFGVPLDPYASLEEAVASWPTPASSLGARLEPDGSWTVCAPFGLVDLFALTVRPNRRLVTREAYLAKAEKWSRLWPELVVLPWDA